MAAWQPHSNMTTFCALYSFACDVLEFEVISTIHKRRGQYKITSKHNTAKRVTCITKHNTIERRWRHRTKRLVYFTNQTLFKHKEDKVTHWRKPQTFATFKSVLTVCKHRPYYQPRFAPPCSSWACKSMTTTWLPSHNTANDVLTSPITTATDQPGTRRCSTVTAREGSGKNKPSLLPCVSTIQTHLACLWPYPSLCQAPVLRTRWSLWHGKRSLLPPLLCCWGLSLAYADIPLTITVPLPWHWKSRPRSSSISGYLFFFSRMPSVSRATDLEKARVLSWDRRTVWPFLSIVLESGEPFNKLRLLAQMPPCKGYPAQWPLHLLQAPLSNPCRSRRDAVQLHHPHGSQRILLLVGQGVGRRRCPSSKERSPGLKQHWRTETEQSNSRKKK